MANDFIGNTSKIEFHCTNPRDPLSCIQLIMVDRAHVEILFPSQSDYQSVLAIR